MLATISVMVMSGDRRTDPEQTRGLADGDTPVPATPPDGTTASATSSLLAETSIATWASGHSSARRQVGAGSNPRYSYSPRAGPARRRAERLRCLRRVAAEPCSELGGQAPSRTDLGVPVRSEAITAAAGRADDAQLMMA